MAMIKEYGGKESYKSKSAMKKHEGKESKKMESKESAKGMHKMPDGKMMKNSGMKMGYAKGGMVHKMPKAC
jgi:hypothetical protein